MLAIQVLGSADRWIPKQLFLLGFKNNWNLWFLRKDIWDLHLASKWHCTNVHICVCFPDRSHIGSQEHTHTYTDYVFKWIGHKGSMFKSGLYHLARCQYSSPIPNSGFLTFSWPSRKQNSLSLKEDNSPF